MASITVIADFKGQNNIPDKELIAENLQLFIDKYEPILFKKLLGEDLYTLFKATPADARFVALLPYLKPADVDYIYWFYLEDQAIQNLGTGAAQSKKKNAVTVSPYPKMVRAWNEMVDCNRELHKYLKDNSDIYPEYNVTFPDWFFYFNGYWFVFSDWLSWFSVACVDEIYRYKNTLGI